MLILPQQIVISRQNPNKLVKNMIMTVRSIETFYLCIIIYTVIPVFEDGSKRERQNMWYDLSGLSEW